MKRTATYTTFAANPAGWSMARGSLVGPGLVHAVIRSGEDDTSDIPKRACDPSELTDARDC
jgi:hypothetical protein